MNTRTCLNMSAEDHDREEEGDSSNMTESLVRLSLSLLSPVASRASAAIETVLPVVWKELQEWKRGLELELRVYEERGNSKTRLVLTVVFVFVVTFHVELVRLFRSLVNKGGVLDQWSLLLSGSSSHRSIRVPPRIF